MAKPITENAQMQCTLGAAPVPLTVTNESGSKKGCITHRTIHPHITDLVLQKKNGLKSDGKASPPV